MLNVVSAQWESEWTIIHLEILMLEIALGIVRGQEKSWVKIFSIYYILRIAERKVHIVGMN